MPNPIEATNWLTGWSSLSGSDLRGGDDAYGLRLVDAAPDGIEGARRVVVRVELHGSHGADVPDLMTGGKGRLALREGVHRDCTAARLSNVEDVAVED